MPVMNGMKEGLPIPPDLIKVEIISIFAAAQTNYQRFLTEGEMAKITKSSGELRYESLAGRFAAKIAASRLLDTAIDMREIEIKNNPAGDPYIQLHGAARNVAFTQDIGRVPVSISHDKNSGHAIAFVVGDKDSVPNIAIGVDTTHLERVKGSAINAIKRKGNKVFTPEEVEVSEDNYALFARRYAVKEAVAKVLVGSDSGGVHYLHTAETILGEQDIEVGKLTGIAEKLARERGLSKWHTRTIQYPSGRTFAFVIAHS